MELLVTCSVTSTPRSVALQYDAETSTGKAGGYWDTGYETIYIADTGTAVTVLVLGEGCDQLSVI